MEWQPIETAPKDGTWILIARFCGDVNQSEPWEFSTGRWCDLGFFTYDGGDNVGDAGDFWMPLPAPPQVKDRVSAFA